MKVYSPTELLDICIRDQNNILTGAQDPKIWPGDILLIRAPNSFSGKLIRFGTSSYWNHAAIYMGQGMTLEADHKGLHVQHLNFYINHKADNEFIVMRPQVINTSDENSRPYVFDDGTRIVKHALKETDNKPGYDFIALGAFFFRFLGMSIPTNPFNIKPLLFCSEAVKTVFINAGYNIVPDFEPSLTSPGDIERDPLIHRVNID